MSPTMASESAVLPGLLCLIGVPGRRGQADAPTAGEGGGDADVRRPHPAAHGAQPRHRPPRLLRELRPGTIHLRTREEVHRPVLESKTATDGLACMFCGINRSCASAGMWRRCRPRASGRHRTARPPPDTHHAGTETFYFGRWKSKRTLLILVDFTPSGESHVGCSLPLPLCV